MLYIPYIILSLSLTHHPILFTLPIFSTYPILLYNINVHGLTMIADRGINYTGGNIIRYAMYIYIRKLLHSISDYFLWFSFTNHFPEFMFITFSWYTFDYMSALDVFILQCFSSMINILTVIQLSVYIVLFSQLLILIYLSILLLFVLIR